MPDTEVFKLLAQFVQQGGTMALWGIVLFQTMSLIKGSLGWVFCFMIVKTITGAIVSLIKWAIENDLKQITRSISKD